MCTTIHTSACGHFRVLVVNRTYIGPAEYIGRRYGRYSASVLANPRSLHAGYKRGETIMHYRRELRAALDRSVAQASWNGTVLTEAERAAIRGETNRLFRVLRSTGEVVLRCWCAPEACHGDEIAAVLLEALVTWVIALSDATREEFSRAA